MDDRIKRITENEARLNRITAWLDNIAGDVREDVRLLDEYYRSPLWREDFEADEAGELPSDLPRGVLSEDAVYNALTEYDERKSKLFKYEDKLVRITDPDGRTFTGIAQTFPADYGEHEYGRYEESIDIDDYVFFESDIKEIEILPTYEEAVQAIPCGKYRHFKGNEYEVIGIARHSETTEPMVVYRALYGDGGLWIRPASMWNETVERDGQVFRRFEQVE